MCNKEGIHQKDSKGFEYQCLKVAKKLVWSAAHKVGENQNGSQGDYQSGYLLGPYGTSCNKNGLIAWNGQITATCKAGIVSYTLANDVPPTPDQGYTSRPSWYPTLNQMFGHGAAEPTCAPSSIQFTRPVLPLDELAPSIPYGLTVGGHVTPIDHAYLGVKTLYLPDADRTQAEYVPITAPADGTIIEIGSLGSPDSHRVVINHGCNVYSVYMVVNRVTGVLASFANEVEAKGYLSLGIKIKAGQEFGRQRDNMLDFNVFSGATWLSGFQNVQSYLSAETWKPYTADFLPFFIPSIRTAMENQMQRTSAPRSGKIDYDVAGSASGNWFLAGTNGYSGLPNSIFSTATKILNGGPSEGKKDGAWSHLSIAPEQVDQSAWIFSAGWWSDPGGDPKQSLLIVDPSTPAPDKLTASSGMVVYALSQLSFLDPPGSPARLPGSRAPMAIGYTIAANGHRLGVVALQVNSDKSLSVEINSTMTSPKEFLAFTSAKRIYTR
ncbi:MAG: hypothetical protein WCO08_07045 [Actinomycetes bacterium]